MIDEKWTWQKSRKVLKEHLEKKRTVQIICLIFSFVGFILLFQTVSTNKMAWIEQADYSVKGKSKDSQPMNKTCQPSIHV